MYLKMKVTAVMKNSRVMRSGDNKGETMHSVNIYGIAEDGVPCQFAITGLPTAARAEEIAAKYPQNSNISVQHAPREPYYVEADQIQITK